ncbi:MAG: NAD-binding protein [Coriobacteriia bacterium]
MNVIIVGAGRVAQTLARKMSDEGHELTLVVESTEIADQMAVRFPRALVIRGSGTSESVLRDARAQDCDAFYAVDEDDSHTMVACLLARDRFHIKNIVALASACEDLPAFTALEINSVCGPDVLVDALLTAV